MNEKIKCPKCRRSFEEADVAFDSEIVCPLCGETFAPETALQRPEEKPPLPKNYLVWAILSMIIGVLPLGIIATVNATRVNKRYLIGDYAGALKASENAKEWCKASFFGLAAAIAFIVFMML